MTEPHNPWAPPKDPGTPVDDATLEALEAGPTMHPVLRILVLLLLTAAVCGFGFSGLCGGFLTITALTGGVSGYLALAIPVLLISGGIVWWLLILMRRVWRNGRRPSS